MCSSSSASDFDAIHTPTCSCSVLFIPLCACLEESLIHSTSLFSLPPIDRPLMETVTSTVMGFFMPDGGISFFRVAVALFFVYYVINKARADLPLTPR